VIGFLLYLIILYVDSHNVSEKSRAFPMVVIVIAFIAAILKLLTYKFPRLKFLDPSGNVAKDVLSVDDSCEPVEEPVQSGEKEADAFSIPAKIFLIALWLISFAVGIYFIGFLPTLAVWLFIFMVGISRIKPAKALLLSVSTFAVLYIVFVILLKTYFSRGILF
jgi:hypothetical protein